MSEQMIPPRFFQAMSMEELQALLFERNGILTAQECQRLWHMCEYQGEPPRTLQVQFDKADILRWLPWSFFKMPSSKETEHVMNEVQKVPERRDDAQSLMELILRPDISEDRLRFLTATHKDMVDRQARLEYFAAKAQMGPEMPVIEKKGKISYESKRTGKSRSTPYELWEDVVEIITPVCSKFGFSIDHQAWTEPPEVPPGKVKVTTYLRHIGGHWEQTSFVAPLDSSGEKNVIQQAKSTVSYLKRINAGLLINFVARGEDNDGADGPETASGGATLSDEQIKQLEANIKAVKLDRAMFLAKYKLSEVSELAANKFQVAMSDVTAYGRKHKEPTK